MSNYTGVFFFFLLKAVTYIVGPTFFDEDDTNDDYQNEKYHLSGKGDSFDVYSEMPLLQMHINL
ncbi:hypothetical protein BCR42DRAFT_404986 [Absidia repens]|uniref:Uncharacterized protein n=1 Tax=Absidia repens TaxID=90262 RepID=A0A1X2IYJ8_9FUNG|nr:hypothetical protein BCR42DRAFT_404986 [Absidia repens]